MMDDYKFKLGLAIAREEELKKKLEQVSVYDEAKEMELCMIAYEDISDHTKAFFKEFKQGWMACAKYRARSAE